MQQRSKAEMGRKLRMIGASIAVLMAVSPQAIGDAVDDWIAKLSSDMPAVREEAIIKLGDSKDPRAIAPLIQILEPKKAPAVSGPGAAATDPSAAKVQEAKRLVGREDRAGATAPVPLDAATLKQCTAGLRSNNPTERTAAVQQLGQSGDKRATKLLMAALQGRDFFARAEIIEALGTLGDPQAFAVISGAVKAQEVPVRKAAVKALGELGEPRGAELLYQALTTDVFLRSEATEALGRLGTADGVKYLNLAAKNKDIFLRQDAQKALDALGVQHGLEPLIALLQDPDAKVRTLAAQALGEIGDPAAAEALKNASGDSDVKAAAAIGQVAGAMAGATASPAQRAKVLAVEALGKVGDARAVEPLVRAMRSGDETLQKAAGAALGSMKSPAVMRRFQMDLTSKDSEVCKQAISDLGYIGTDEAVKLLGQAAGRTEVPIAKEAVAAMSKSGKPAAIPYLTKAVSNPFLRQEALEGIFAIDHPDTVPILIQLLSSKSFVDRQKAAAALGRRKEPKAVEPLIGLLKANDTPVMEEAIKALDEIGDKKAGSALIELVNQPFVGEQALTLIRKWDWKPQTVREKCLWFMANKQWAECAKLGPEAADLLLEELKKSNSGDVAEAMATLKDARAVPILTAALAEWRAGTKHVKALEALGWKADSFDKQVLRAAATGDTAALKKFWKQDDRMRQMVEKVLNSTEGTGLSGVASLIISLRLTDMVQPLAGKLSAGTETQQWSLANQFLKSKNETLYNAAKSWADSHGYRVIEFRIPGPSDRW
jgi:HEAT repeat protein